MIWGKTFGAAFVVCLLAAWWLNDPSVVTGPHDPKFYWWMSEGRTVIGPFAYRPLVPMLVRLSPISGHTGFLVLTSALLAVTVATVWVWLRAHASAWRSAAGVAVFVANITFWGSLRSVYTTDAALLAGLAVAAWAADRGRWDLFAACAALTAAGREVAVCLAAIPVLVGLQRGRLERWMVAGAVAPVVVVLAVRVGFDALPRPMQTPEFVFAFRAWQDGSLWRSVFDAFRWSFGPFWVALLLAWRRLPYRTQVWAIPAAAGFLSCLIATDWTRLLAPAAPLIAAAVAFGSTVDRPVPEVREVLSGPQRR